MSRLDIAQWCDFVRGVADPESERRMRQRLAAGDAAARRAVDLLSRVRTVSRGDEVRAVPEHAVRAAKAIATVRRPAAEAPGSSLWRFLPVELTFDNLRQPALAGTRDLQASSRQLSFRAEDYTVDLRLEPDEAPRTTALVGQLVRRWRGSRPVTRTPVLVAANGEIVDTSTTNRFGEFQAAGLPREPLDLYLLVGEDTCIRLPLDQDPDE